MQVDNEQRLREIRHFWDSAAATFDDEPDHGLRDPSIRNAWTAHLTNWLPAPPAAILDVGCGTGSLSVLLGQLGHTVTGIDVSPAMIAQAMAKAQAADQQITFAVMDAAQPQLGQQQFQVIICRHLLWTVPEPAQVLRRWLDHLALDGRLILIEGFWHTGVGLHAQAVVEMLPTALQKVTVRALSDEPALWGGHVSDERYVVIAHRSL